MILFGGTGEKREEAIKGTGREGNGRKTGKQRHVQSIKYVEYHFLKFINFKLNPTRLLRKFLFRTLDAKIAANSLI